MVYINKYFRLFSILFANYKGDLKELIKGVQKISSLKDNDTILIAEACTHHPIQDDIGTVKIPKWIDYVKQMPQGIPVKEITEKQDEFFKTANQYLKKYQGQQLTNAFNSLIHMFKIRKLSIIKLNNLKHKKRYCWNNNAVMLCNNKEIILKHNACII